MGSVNLHILPFQRPYFNDTGQVHPCLLESHRGFRAGVPRNANDKDALCRWKELRVLVAQLSVQTEHLENAMRIDYKRQTGIRAVRDLWKKLDTKILEAPYLPELSPVSSIEVDSQPHQ